MNRRVVGLILTSLFLVDGWSLAAESEFQVSKLVSVDQIVNRIYPGMTRAELETLLPDRDGGPQSISSTKYYRTPGFIIEVPYDQTGGTWTLTNRVNGPVSVTVGQRSTL